MKESYFKKEEQFAGENKFMRIYIKYERLFFANNRKESYKKQMNRIKLMYLNF